MATAKHGRKFRLLLDMSVAADSAATIVPMTVSWNTNRTTDKVEVTSSDSSNKEYVSGFADYSGTVEANGDADSDLLYAAADGQPRMHYLYPDFAGTPGRYNYGKITLDASESGGVSAKWGQTVNFSASGPITRVGG